MEAKVISIFSKKRKEDKEENEISLEEIMKNNELNKKRMAEERKKDNEKLKKNWSLIKK